MKASHFSLFFLFFVSSASIGQRLSLNDLHSIASSQNWEHANQFLMKKGWEYYESSKGNSERYNTITWSYNRSYEDKAEGWFYVYTVEKIPNKIAYTTFNKPSYTSIQSSLASNGYQLVDSEIKDDAITSTYQNKNYIIDITTDKREGSSSFDESITGYRFVVVKRQGAFDYDNGAKTDYHSNGNISMEYELRNGKIHGPLKVYHENGQLKKTGTYLNGKQNGFFTEYNELGNKLVEYTMKDDYKNGKVIFYENEVKSTSTTYQNDIRHGEYNEYLYNDEGELIAKNVGQFINDNKTDEWKLYYVGDGENKVIKRTTFKNGEKNGPFQDFQGDSLIVGNYSDDLLNGPYRVFLDVKRMLIGGLITTDTTKLQELVTGHYDDGYKTGHWKYFDLTQALSSEGIYRNDKKEGTWKSYYSKFSGEDNKEKPYSQKLYLIENYKEGKLHGEVKRFSYLNKEEIPCPENSKKKEDCYKLEYQEVDELYNYKNGLLDGPFHSVTQSTKQIGHYKEGEKSGKWTEFENGKIVAEYGYRKGKFDDDFIFYSNNIPLFKRTFKDGKLIRAQDVDSLGVAYMEFEYVRDNSKGSIWTRKYKIGDWSIQQEYQIKDGAGIENPFFLFLLKENDEENYNAFKSGAYHVYDENGKILVQGFQVEEKRIGRWVHYFYDQQIKVKTEYDNGENLFEKYFDLNDNLFSGKFVYKKELDNVEEIRKIKNGLRHGNTIFKDIATGKTIKKEKYKKGILR